MLTVKVDQRVRDQIVVETHGNPLALVELPRELAAAQLAGGFGQPGAMAVPRDAEEMFRHCRMRLRPGRRDHGGDPAHQPALLA